MIHGFRVCSRLFERSADGGGAEVLRADGLQATAGCTVATLPANPFAEGDVSSQGLGRLAINSNRYYRRVKVANLM